MPIVLAIEPDRRQAAHVSAVVRHRVGAELILADTTESALDAIGNRVPDLVLVPALLSPQDDAALAAALRVIAAAAHVRTLTIPVFANNASNGEGGGLLARLRRSRSEPTSSVGCDPAVFAEQIKDYLREAAEERVEREEAAARTPIPLAASTTIGGMDDETPVIDSTFVDAPAFDTPEVDTPAFDMREVETPPFEMRDEAPAFETRDVEATLDAPAAAAAEPSLVEPSLVEPSLVEPAFAEQPFAEPPLVETPAAHAAILETPVDDPYIAAAAFDSVIAADAPDADEPLADVPIEPKRLIAPVIVARAKPAPPRAPALDFVEKPPAAHDDRSFGVTPSGVNRLPAATAAHRDALDDPRDNNGPTIDLSATMVETPEGASASDQDLVGGERFGVYTRPLDESLETAAGATDDPASSEGSNEATAIASFAEFLEPPPSKKPDETSWSTLGLPCSRQWPAMEGALVEAKPRLADLVIAAGRAAAAKPVAKQADAPQPPAAAPTRAASATTVAPTPGARPDHRDWSELVASLRQDIERRRKQPPSVVTPIAARPPEPHPPAAHARPHLHAIDGKAGQRPRKSTPVQDEWGFFDPQQCGFAALLAKLDEFSEAADEPEVRKTS